MLRRGKKAICIVEAKKDDVEKGLAQFKLEFTADVTQEESSKVEIWRELYGEYNISLE
jgi:hypothetical protein